MRVSDIMEPLSLHQQTNHNFDHERELDHPHQAAVQPRLHQISRTSNYQSNHTNKPIPWNSNLANSEKHQKRKNKHQDNLNLTQSTHSLHHQNNIASKHKSQSQKSLYKKSNFTDFVKNNRLKYSKQNLANVNGQNYLGAATDIKDRSRSDNCSVSSINSYCSTWRLLLIFISDIQ